MKRWVELTLGIVTSIGGYLDVGAIATAAQAGALFRFDLMWVVLLGTVCVIALTEMSGRLAAVSGHPLRAAERERMGLNFFVWTAIVGLFVNVLVLAAELSGVGFALELVTGVSFRWWTPAVAAVVWIVLWKGTFDGLEKVIGALGLVTLAFVVAAARGRPPMSDLLAGLVPSAPTHEATRYWFIAASILGALISPYMFYFYSSGAVEDKWNESHVGINRVVAGAGMAFGGMTAFGVLIAAGLAFHPHGIRVERYGDAAPLLEYAFGSWGVPLFAASLGIACFGASAEVALTNAYVMAQGLGWEWGEQKRPCAAPRFALAYSVPLVVAAIPGLFGLEPLALTVFTMALTAVTLPLEVLPFLVIMNDERYMAGRTNGRIANALVLLVIGLAFVLAIVTIPLELLGG